MVDGSRGLERTTVTGLALRNGCELVEVAEGVWDYVLKAWPVDHC